MSRRKLQGRKPAKKKKGDGEAPPRVESRRRRGVSTAIVLGAALVAVVAVTMKQLSRQLRAASLQEDVRLTEVESLRTTKVIRGPLRLIAADVEAHAKRSEESRATRPKVRPQRFPRANGSAFLNLD